MENYQHDQQYNIIPQQEENVQLNQIFEEREEVDPCNFCLLLICGISTLFGGYLISMTVFINEYSTNNCMTIVQILKYYSQYLMIDGMVQIIVIFIIFCCLIPIQKYNIKKQVDKQISFQFYDQLFIFIVTIIILAITKDQKSCLNVGSKILLVLYVLLIYFLTFILAAQKWNL
ncbi:unnamed protein product [Paramecium sonneborni]|uniref:Transmembrane protein n=1 Tax=Paramecium sonneborni TaxID=65129 RepID=A0A8S1P3T7_9CILI|nr:unnamed protein product [Paramecium sonneborni]